MNLYSHHPRQSTWMPLKPQVFDVNIVHMYLIKNHVRIIAQARFITPSNKIYNAKKHL